ncbi:MAG: uracil-DNA glycosylase [Verrucomicrobiota bacterium]
MSGVVRRYRTKPDDDANWFLLSLFCKGIIMTSASTSGEQRTITRLEAKRRLSCLVEDLARHVDNLREEGITEVACSPAMASESLLMPGAFVKVAQPQPKQNIDLSTIALATAEHPIPSSAEALRPGESNTEHRIEEIEAGAELKAIAQAAAACKKCGLHAKRRQAVPGQGNIHPDILFIGEGPGEDEDKQGIPFVGRSGQLLTRLINRMGYTRDMVFIANIIKCRPPNNRKPLPEEMNSCRPYLERQIAVLKPKVIVLLGASAFEGLIPPKAPGLTISRVRGKWLEYKGIPAMPTFHPSYLLRNQSAMWDVWSDMELVLNRLGRTPPPAPGSK